jgi:hypothetical protein
MSEAGYVELPGNERDSAAGRLEFERQMENCRP